MIGGTGTGAAFAVPAGRFLPALFARDGRTVAPAQVGHRPRPAPQSIDGNLQRAPVGAVDRFGVAGLICRRCRAHALPARGGARQEAARG